jgi:hypothetical protein
MRGMTWVVTPEQVRRFIDDKVPVFLTLDQGATATVLLVGIERNHAVSKRGLRFPIENITEIRRSDGLDRVGGR